jgi:type II secretory pathway pseudopilin PulG
MVEMLIVILVIGILAAIAYPVYTAALERARATQDMNNLRQIAVATQTYLNDNDGVLFSSGNSWMNQLHPKYLSAWSIFQSPFDKRRASEVGDSTTPVSYGINSNAFGTDSGKISNPSVFIIFAPAQASGPIVTFQGTATQGQPGITVIAQGNNAKSTPGGNATGGTHSSRKRINALCGDLHAENMLWSVFTTTNSSSDPTAAQRWSP